MLNWIKNREHLQQIQQEHKEFLVLAFYGAFSSAAKHGLDELKQFSRDNEKIPVYVIDVGKVKGVHKDFGVTSVPTVISLEKGKVTERVEGVESGRYYSRIFAGALAFQHQKSGKVKLHHVVVYSGPGCPACGTAKAYLRRRGIGFREVDVSRDRHAADRLVARSGQMAVPQIDVDGHLVVGFSQARLDALLSP